MDEGGEGRGEGGGGWGDLYTCISLMGEGGEGGRGGGDEWTRILASLVTLCMSSTVIPYTLDNAEKALGYDYDVGRSNST